MHGPRTGLTSSLVRRNNAADISHRPPSHRAVESNTRNPFTTMSSRNTSDFGVKVICAAGIPRDPNIVRPNLGTHMTNYNYLHSS
jgi:hypothetical protein